MTCAPRVRCFGGDAGNCAVRRNELPTGGTSSGTGGNPGTGAIRAPRSLPAHAALCDFEPGCLDPNSPSPEHVRATLSMRTGARDAAPRRMQLRRRRIRTPSASVHGQCEVCADAALHPIRPFGLDVVNKWTSMPAVAVLWETPRAAVSRSVKLPSHFPAGLPWGAQVTHCVLRSAGARDHPDVRSHRCERNLAPTLRLGMRVPAGSHALGAASVLSTYPEGGALARVSHSIQRAPR